ncbi:MAG: hypothetical protein JNK82_35580 [Myxococcaceae bacterium]|nr:hypothetical protein [Myxococcaceae bacterium]
MNRALPLLLSLVPALVALPTLSDPWGNSEESLNAAIWSLGAKNLVELGPSPSLRGARVSPHGGTKGDGVYAHHPPLPVWLSVLALPAPEVGVRLLGLACVTASLLLLHRLLRRFFEPRVALVGLAAAASSVFALRYGRLFTTLTLAAPLYLALVVALVEQWRERWVLPLVAALVLSSWDGVVAAAAAVLWLRRPAPAAVLAATLAFVVWHLTDAAGGVQGLVWQFRWRAAGDAVTWLQWAQGQARMVGEGVGPVSLLALLVVPKQHRRTLLMLLVPGVVMLLVFRQGAVRHAFWGYNLVFPAAFAVAAAVTRWPRAGAALALAQALVLVPVAVWRLQEEHVQNDALGRVAKTLPKGGEVAVFSARSFHPYVAWYAGAKPLTVRTVAELNAASQEVLLVDTFHAGAVGCALRPGPRWQVVGRAALGCKPPGYSAEGL